MSSSEQEASGGGRIEVKLPANLDPTYANFALITHSPSELIIDFAQVMPQVKQARVRTRVVMTPTNAKLLLRALQERLNRYEAQFGEIKIPQGSSLAEQLFRGNPGSQDEGEGPDDDEGPEEGA